MDNPSEMTPHIHADGLALLMLATSPLFVFYGRRLFRLVLALVGFLSVAYIVHVGLEKTSFSSTMIIMLSLAAGVFGALLMVGVMRLGVFVIGAMCGVMSSNLFYQIVANKMNTPDNSPETLRYIVIVVMALLGGVLFVCFEPALVAVLTAFFGAYMFAAGFDHIGYRFGFWDDAPLDPTTFFTHPERFECSSNTPGGTACHTLVGVWVVLFVVGVLFQLRLIGHQRDLFVEDKPTAYGSVARRVHV